MQRAYEAYLNDILESIRKIEKYTENMPCGDFREDELRQDAVARNLEIVWDVMENKLPDLKKNTQAILSEIKGDFN